VAKLGLVAAAEVVVRNQQVGLEVVVVALVPPPQIRAMVGKVTRSLAELVAVVGSGVVVEVGVREVVDQVTSLLTQLPKLIPPVRALQTAQSR
jgi:hypothetical protein